MRPGEYWLFKMVQLPILCGLTLYKFRVLESGAQCAMECLHQGFVCCCCWKAAGKPPRTGSIMTLLLIDSSQWYVSCKATYFIFGALYPS